VRIWTATTHIAAYDDSAAERAEALDPAVGALAAVAESGPEEPPERVAAETDCEEREQEVTEGMLFDRPAELPAGL
jgi:hypothetical protein